MNSVGSGYSNLCINDILTDDELRSILAKLESEKDKEIFGLVCKRWLRLQSTEKKKLAARAGPHRLHRMADRFTRLLELDLAQSVSRSFYPSVTDSNLNIIANGFTCLRVFNLHNSGEGCKGYCRSEYGVCLPVVAVPKEGACSWIGMKCDPIMERDARGAVGQIIRYEKAEGPVKVSREAHEPANFWEVFSRFLPLMDKSYSKVESYKSSAKVQPSKRKVGSYDVDYEVFQKAIVGGFVPPFPSSEDEHETHLPARESSWSTLRRKVSSSKDWGGDKTASFLFPRTYMSCYKMFHATWHPLRATSAPSLLAQPLSSSANG